MSSQPIAVPLNSRSCAFQRVFTAIGSQSGRPEQRHISSIAGSIRIISLGRIATRSCSRGTLSHPQRPRVRRCSPFEGPPSALHRPRAGAVVAPTAVSLASNLTSHGVLARRYFLVAMGCVHAYVTSFTRPATLPGENTLAARVLCRVRCERQRRLGHSILIQAAPAGIWTVKGPMRSCDWR